jgi:hypothetical protein
MEKIRRYAKSYNDFCIPVNILSLHLQGFFGLFYRVIFPIVYYFPNPQEKLKVTTELNKNSKGLLHCNSA